MVKEKTSIERYCGNCGFHSPYEYPNKIFCEYWFINDRNADPIKETLYSCEKWKPKSQPCFCVREALKKRTYDESK